MENLSLVLQSPVEQRLVEEEGREEREQIEVGRDHSPVVVAVEVVEEGEEGDLGVTEVRSLDLARLPAQEQVWSPA